ncbi:MAG: imidazolonepropionase [Firmicutes bacterium]|nr:imidazolonepropionase [Bacillota bacterium]
MPAEERYGASGDLVVRHARVLPMAFGGAVRGSPPTLPEVPDGAVAVVAGRIAYVGADTDLPAPLRALPTLDAAGRAVLPGLVDCHTHVPFAAWRADEHAERLAGATYAAQQGGEGGRPRGIARSAAQLAAAADADVLAFSHHRLGECLAAGTTTVELKSGYGLQAAQEMRLLALMQRLAAEVPQRVVRTGLFLHGPPPPPGREAWAQRVVSELMPRALAQGLLDGVDAFVEAIAYRLEDAVPLIEAAQRAGLATHLHAAQLEPSAAAAWAASRGLTSVDHLDHLDPDGVRALAASPTVAVLLPGATFLTGGATRPPARALLAAGACVAVATDLNPGTSPLTSLPEAAALACRLFELTMEEALAAVTVNAAAALGLGHEVGSLEVGKRGDLVVLEGDEPALLVYRLGHPAVETVVAAGRIAYRRSDGGAKAS